MLRFPIVVLGLLCCAPIRPPKCVTACGMGADDGNCEALREFEIRTVLRLQRAVPAWKAEKTCSALRLFRIEIHGHHEPADGACDARAWRNGSSCFYGSTSFFHETIELTDVDWNQGALAHEIAHVAEAANTGGYGHCRWADFFLREALGELSTLPDPSSPEKSCP